MESIGTPWLWSAFLALVGAMLALDLGVFHRKAHAVSLRSAATWSAVWIALALAFAGGVSVAFGPQRGLEFTTGWLIEKALSVDNVFVFVVVFRALAIPPALQHRVLFWGVLGALVFRGVFIFAGVALLERFHGLLYVFGGLLLLTGIRLLRERGEPVHPERQPLFRLFQRLVPATPTLHGTAFWVRQGGRWLATPLFVTLVLIEITDVIFALDSIPAIFAVTRDPFLVFTSNLFAILGLRSLYFLLAGAIERMVHLKTGLALVLIFVAAKMLLADWFHVPIGVSLAVIASLIGGAVVSSLRATAGGRATPTDGAADVPDGPPAALTPKNGR